MFVLNVVGKGADPAPFAALASGAAVILSPGRAFDLPLGAQGSPQLLASARALGDNLALDVNIVSTANRRKKLLLADMDSTVITVECLDELAALAGLGPRIAAITARAMRGEMEFEAALRERVALLAGLPLSLLEETYAQKVRLDPGAKSLVATMRANGAHTMLVSGGFTFFTHRVAQAAGFDADQGNVLLDDSARVLGRMAEPVRGPLAKRTALEKAAADLNLDLAQTLAVGDGANDLAMIGAAGLGVAYHAKPVVEAAAAARIAHNDLRALLYLQGHADAQIVSPA